MAFAVTRSRPLPVPRSSLLVAAFSTVVEWYDFTLYLYFAPVLSKVFFGGSSDSVLATLGVFAISYVMRPLGALWFGNRGDRLGRRRVLLVSMSLMTAAMFATACLPTHAQAGFAAPLLLFLLRCVMGFSVGGEYSGVLAYLVESCRARNRGLTVSLASAASEVGGLLAVGIGALTTAVVSARQLDTWGWRIPFLVGALLAGVVLAARSTMQEAADFHEAQQAGALAENPLGEVMKGQRRAVVTTFAVSALGSVTFYVGVTFVPTFLTETGGMGATLSLWLSTIASAVVIAATPVAGWLSDRVGRRPVLLGTAVFFVVVPLGMFALMAGGSAGRALTGAVVLAAGAGAWSAVAASAVPEQFSTAGRLTGLGLGYAVATALFGGLSPYLAAQLVAATGWQPAPGAMVMAVALAVIPFVLRMPETAGTDLAAKPPGG